jgi:hypothetical protein
MLVYPEECSVRVLNTVSEFWNQNYLPYLHEGVQIRTYSGLKSSSQGSKGTSARYRSVYPDPWSQSNLDVVYEDQKICA